MPLIKKLSKKMIDEDLKIDQDEQDDEEQHMAEGGMVHPKSIAEAIMERHKQKSLHGEKIESDLESYEDDHYMDMDPEHEEREPHAEGFKDEPSDLDMISQIMRKMKSKSKK